MCDYVINVNRGPKNLRNVDCYPFPFQDGKKVEFRQILKKTYVAACKGQCQEPIDHLKTRKDCAMRIKMQIIPWLHLGYTKKIQKSTGKLWKNSEKMFKTPVFFPIKMELY